MILRVWRIHCLMPIAGAEDLPATDEQLRSAYCIPVVQTQVRAESSSVAAIDEARKAKDKQADEMSAGGPDYIAHRLSKESTRSARRPA